MKLGGIGKNIHIFTDVQLGIIRNNFGDDKGDTNMLNLNMTFVGFSQCVLCDVNQGDNERFR